MKCLTGIGKRTALRLVLHLLKQPKEQTGFLSQALVAMREDISKLAAVITSQIVSGEICANQSRNHKLSAL
jgi:recombination protein RecR